MSMSSLMPSRFLSLVAHFVILVTAMSDKKANVLASLPWDFTEEEWNGKMRELSAGLIVSLVFICVELVTFLFGVTMFLPMQSVISIFCHGGGAITMGIFLVDVWDTYWFWWSFGVFSAVPFACELASVTSVLCLFKGT
ncbi:unnamed protein product [Notodromas monacha]|uniref:Transmembrane protein 107 n=1 Tax=Notodromas monacha TaxID=399045 RepID=A0A7R9BUX2_9CRUS|nr:unnamed protein product [Notodromas monacha]CAG0920582.1 unnamed protein product [Notodromas monacha]